MGSSSTKSQQQQQSQSTTSGTNTGHAVSSVDVPDWLQNPTMGFASQIGDLQAQGPAAFTPTASAGQNQAYDAAANLVNPAYGVAKSTLTNLADVQGQSVLDNLSAYYNPFKDQVLNPVMADFDAQAGQTRAAQAAAAAQNKAFGGSRYGVQEAQTEDNLARGRATTEGGLLNSMYGQATSMSEADAARRQAAAVQNQNTGLQKAQELANIRTSEADQARQNAGAQLTAGNAQYATDTATKQYPLEYLKTLEGSLQGLDPSMYAGSTVDTSGTNSASSQSTGSSSGKTSSNPGLLANLGSIMQMGAMFV